MKTRKQLKEIYSQACAKRQDLFRKLSKDQGLIGLAIWSDPQMKILHAECERAADEWRTSE